MAFISARSSFALAAMTSCRAFMSAAVVSCMAFISARSSFALAAMTSCNAFTSTRSSFRRTCRSAPAARLRLNKSTAAATTTPAINAKSLIVVNTSIAASPGLAQGGESVS